LNIGSCGSNSAINNMFYITKAVKFDRGVLNMDSKFELRKDKLLLCEIITENKIISSDLPENIIFSSNFLFDMETFDFMKCCNRYEAKCLGPIRIVSDNGTTNSKLFRIFNFNMSKISSILYNIIFKYSKCSYIHPKIKLPKSEIDEYEIIKISNISLLSLNTILKYKETKHLLTGKMDFSYNRLLDLKLQKLKSQINEDNKGTSTPIYNKIEELRLNTVYGYRLLDDILFSFFCIKPIIYDNELESFAITTLKLEIEKDKTIKTNKNTKKLNSVDDTISDSYNIYENNLEQKYYDTTGNTSRKISNSTKQ